MRCGAPDVGLKIFRLHIRKTEQSVFPTYNMNHRTYSRTQSTFGAVFLAFLSSGSWLCSVSCLSSSAHAKTPFVADSALSRRSVLSISAWSLLVGEAVLPRQAGAAEGENPLIYTRQQKVLNSKELHYDITIPSTMKEGSKPVKTHLDEVNFVSEDIKRYQYGITVDPVRIASLKEVCSANCCHFVVFVIISTGISGGQYSPKDKPCEWN